MFERFTDRARKVVTLSQEEAKMLNHSYIGTEHILLGLVHEGEGVAAKALESLGITLEAIREQVVDTIGNGQQPSIAPHIPFTPRAKKVLQLSLREALQLGHNYIGTEHILLGLIREGEGVAAQVLVKMGADLNRVRQQVIQLLNGYSGKGGVVVAQSSPANNPTPPVEGMDPLTEPGSGENGDAVFAPIKATVFTEPIKVLVDKAGRRKVMIEIFASADEEIDVLKASITYRDGQGAIHKDSRDWSKTREPKKAKKAKKDKAPQGPATIDPPDASDDTTGSASSEAGAEGSPEAGPERGKE